MRGNGHTRFCGECGLHVHNLSAMTRDEAEAFLANRTGRVCVAFRPKDDGTPVVLDYRPAAPSRRWLKLAGVAAAASLAAAACEQTTPAGPMLAGRVGPPNPMVAGGLMPAPARAYPPDPAGAPNGWRPTTQPSSILDQADPNAAAIRRALPEGAALAEIAANAYPFGRSPGYGRAYVISRDTAPATPDAPAYAAAVWVMPGDYVGMPVSEDTTRLPQRVAHLASGDDVYCWPASGPLKEVIVAALKAEDGTGPTTKPARQ